MNDRGLLLLLLLVYWHKRREQGQAVQPTPFTPDVKASFTPVKLAHFPVPGVVSYADNFGHQWGPGRTHQGIDIFAPEGTPVLAVADGIVRNKEGPIGGKMVTLELPDKTWFLYSHLATFGPKPSGSHVKAGDLVGHVGDTGNALRKGAHVHFEAHPKGGPAVDPYAALKAVSVDGPAEPGTMPQ